MPYIGNQPSESFTSFATQEFSTSATTSYTLDHAVTNENEIALFINNVRQQPGSGKAYTATGTALTLSAATASTDTMYCVFLGRALQTVNPAGGSIGSSQLSADAITGQTALTSAPDSTDELLISDAGTLKRIDVSLIGGNMTPAFEAFVTSDQSISDATSTKIAFGTEVYDTDSAFDHSSNYRFTVPSGKAGKYFFYTNILMENTSNYIASSIWQFKVNGSTVKQGKFNPTNSVISYIQEILTATFDLSAGDYVETFAYISNASGSSILTSASRQTNFGGFRIIT